MTVFSVMVYWVTKYRLVRHNHRNQPPNFKQLVYSISRVDICMHVYYEYRTCRMFLINPRWKRYATENRIYLRFLGRYYLWTIPWFWHVCGEVFIRYVLLATFLIYLVLLYDIEHIKQQHIFAVFFQQKYLVIPVSRVCFDTLRLKENWYHIEDNIY